MFRAIVIALVFIALAVYFGRAGTPPASPAPAPHVLTEDEKAAAARQRAASEAYSAKEFADFAANRDAIIAKAKKLNAVGKYQDAADLGMRWAFARDELLNAQTEIARDKLSAIAMAKGKAEARKRGVSIGMTKEDVLGSSWGRPESVNTTTTARGIHEQWVYPGHHSYLYFDNDVLTAIQN